MTTILDVLRRAASDPAFESRLAHDPLDAARAVGLQTRCRGDARYLEARLAALARPLDAEPTPEQLEEAAAETRAGLGLKRTAAAREAARALFFLRDYRFHQRLLSSAGPSELTALIDRFRSQGPPPGRDRGTLLITLHYGPFPLLWLWLKHAESRGVLPPFTLLYDTRLYKPDLTPAQYGRLAAAGSVPPARRDLDIAAIGIRPAIRNAVMRLRAGETVLMFPDAFAVSDRERTLICHIGQLEIAYPRGAVWLAQAADSTVQGAVLRPRGDSHTILWGAPRPGPVTHSAVTEALQELLDASVARDPAPWLAWFGHDDAADTSLEAATPIE